MFGFAEVAAVVVGLALLVWSADRFIDGAAALAKYFGVPSLIIGLVIVGIGTSAPEMIVGSFAALEGNTNLAIGNAIGSNITNIALVLGITSLVAPLVMKSSLLKRELPILLGITLVSILFFLDNRFDRWEGIVLVSGMAVFVAWMVNEARITRSHDPIAVEIVAEVEHEIPEKVALLPAMTSLLIGLVVLLGSAKLIVWGAVAIAQAMGISDLVIGLTVVAIGTSLPELAATVMSARKGEHDIAIGNVIGSNIFNLLGVLGLPAIIHPTDIDPHALYRDYPLMIALTIGLFIMGRGSKRKPGHIYRWEGGLLVGIYAAYLAVLYFTS